jgi:uncharacterized protein (DUF1800 family)
MHMSRYEFSVCGRSSARGLTALGLGALTTLMIVSGLPRAAHAQDVASASDAARFLEQATFGPTAFDIAYIQDPARGFAGWLTDQFSMPVPGDYIPMETCPTATGRCPANAPTGCGGGTACNRTNYTMHDLQQRFFFRALNGPDQLRQRVAFALNQIMVISAQDGQVNRLNRMQPYIQTLEQDAFGNFRDLLYDITLNAGMGRYLDMVNNNKNAPNENYAREILQLFSIGLDRLNPDGTPILDDQGNRSPTYTQETVTNFAQVFTGWTFEVQPAPTEAGYVNYIDPMRVGNENNHDRNPKMLLDHGDPNCTLPGGENAAPELAEAIACIVSSPYVAPYMGKNLIQHLVTSNPTPAYVGRVSNAFISGSFTDPATSRVFGTGLRGDLQAVIAAILLDPEARGDAAPSAYHGHLREPVLFVTSLLRAFNTSDNNTDYVLGEAFLPADIRMDEDVFRSPTVFNFFPPSYEIPGERTCGNFGTDQCLGPEFNIQSTATSLARVNFAQEVIFHQMPTSGDRPSGTWIDEATLAALPTDDPQVLVDTLNTQMMHGSMTTDMNSRLVNAVLAITDPAPAVQALKRAREAVYLIATSSQYNVER